jgi:hypothetical protein
MMLPPNVTAPPAFLHTAGSSQPAHTMRITTPDQALEILQSGTEAERITARFYLADIFEQRGMIQEAVELLEGNARAGVSDPRLYTALISHYRTLGRYADADSAMAYAATMMSRQAPPVPPAPALPPTPAYSQPYAQPAQPINITVSPQMTNHTVVQNTVTVGAAAKNSPPFIVRLIYFLLIGCWFGFVWIGIALFLMILIITIPMGIWMLNRTSKAFIL